MRRAVFVIIIAFLAALSINAPPANASENPGLALNVTNLTTFDNVSSAATTISIDSHASSTSFTVASEPALSPSGNALIWRNTAGSDASFVFAINTDANGNFDNETSSQSETFINDTNAATTAQSVTITHGTAEFGAPAEITSALHTATTNYHSVDGFWSPDVQLLE